MVNWTEKFETGHALVDTQHRMLISYINRLEGFARNTNPSTEEVAMFMRVIEFLETYILTHFADEENCMFRFRCPAHKENKRAHSEFLDFFRAFKLRIDAEGYRSELVQELHDSCGLWIQRHILRIDVQLKPCQTPAFPGDPEPA